MEHLGMFTVKIFFVCVFPDLDPILNPKNQVILEKICPVFLFPTGPKVSLRAWFSGSNSSTNHESG